MKVDGSILRELHRILQQQMDLINQRDSGPRKIKAMAAQVALATQGVEDGKNKVRQLKMDSDRKQLQLRERENKIKDLEGKQNQSKTNREYQTLKEQIAADKQANNVLSDEILEAMEQIDQAQQKLVTLEAKLKQVKDDEAKLQQQINDRMVIVLKELERVTGDLKKAEDALPPDFATDFQRLVAGRGEDALAEVDGQSCGGCYQVLSPQVLDKLKQNQPVYCTSCARLLYSADERAGRTR